MPELRNLNWKKFTKDLVTHPEARKALLKSKSLQWASTIALRQQGLLVLDESEDLIIGYKGSLFQVDMINYPRIFEAWDRYRLDQIRESDIVLDAGANIGSYTIPASIKARQVVALEPLFSDTLERNLFLNKVRDKVKLYPALLAKKSGITYKVDCQEYEGYSQSVSFKDIFSTSYDVIRLDLGGEERDLNPYEIGEPRLLEVEFHFWDTNNIEMWNNWKGWLVSRGYDYRLRWSVHRHWGYLSAWKRGYGPNIQEEVHLPDGSFRGTSLKLWRID